MVRPACGDPSAAALGARRLVCAGSSAVPCRSQSVFVRPPAQPIAPVLVKTDHRYLRQPAQLQLIQEFVIVGRPWCMMESVCRNVQHFDMKKKLDVKILQTCTLKKKTFQRTFYINKTVFNTF